MSFEKSLFTITIWDILDNILFSGYFIGGFRYGPPVFKFQGDAATHYCAERANHSAMNHPSKQFGTKHMRSHIQRNSQLILHREHLDLLLLTLKHTQVVSLHSHVLHLETPL